MFDIINYRSIMRANDRGPKVSKKSVRLPRIKKEGVAGNDYH